MKRKTKIILITIVVLLASLFYIGRLFNKKPVIDEDPSTNTCPFVFPSTTTIETTKITEKVVKTTKKTTKKTTHKVNTIKTNTGSKQEYIDYAKSYGNLNNTQLNCLIYLWDHESGWNPKAVNKSSGACGIPQALPCIKIKNQQGSNDWQAQIRWGLNYINYRYKNPCSAWNHFKNKRWY